MLLSLGLLKNTKKTQFKIARVGLNDPHLFKICRLQNYENIRNKLVWLYSVVQTVRGVWFIFLFNHFIGPAATRSSYVTVNLWWIKITFVYFRLLHFYNPERYNEDTMDKNCYCYLELDPHLFKIAYGISYRSCNMLKPPCSMSSINKVKSKPKLKALGRVISISLAFSWLQYVFFVVGVRYSSCTNESVLP